MGVEHPEGVVRQHVIYHGRVQGVFFRATACELAEGHAVVGYARNRPDGTVELEAEGPAAEVAAFLEAVARRYAGHITGTEQTPRDPRGDEGGFSVRY